MASFSDLPQETIDYIIDLVIGEKLCDFGDDGWRKSRSSERLGRDTMAACTLVSSSLHTRSSRHLFQLVSYRTQHALQIASTLEQLPRIASNIQTIVITCRDLELREISRVLGVLPRLHSISITLTDNSLLPLNASNLRPLNLDVRNVHLSRVHSANFLHAFLSLFAVIGHLEINHCSRNAQSSWSRPDSCAPAKHLRVTKLSIDRLDSPALPILQYVLAPDCPTTLCSTSEDMPPILPAVVHPIQELCRATRHVVLRPSMMTKLLGPRGAMGILQLPNLTAMHIRFTDTRTFHGTYSFLDSPVPMVKWLHAKRMRLGFYCTGDLVTVVESSPLFLQALLSMLPSVTTLQIAVVCEGGHQVSATYEQRVRRFADTFASSLQSGSDLHNRLTVQYVGIIPPPEEL